MPVTLIVEDGSNVANSNTYLSRAAANTRAIASNDEAVWSALSDDVKDLNLALALIYIERRFRFYGEALFASQSLQWPRTRNYDNKGILIAQGDIPEQLLQAQMLIALLFATDEELKETDVLDSAGDIKSLSANDFRADFSGPAKGSDLSMSRYASIFDSRVPDLQVILRSIGELKPEEWLTSNKQTVVR